jgi:hypothetical protein
VRSCAARRMGRAAERVHGGCSGSCRRHAFSMRGSAPVEVASPWADPRWSHAQRAGFNFAVARSSSGAAWPHLRMLPMACRSAPRAVPNAWKRVLSAAL